MLIRYCSSFFEEHSRWILEEGTYIVRVGKYTIQELVAQLTVKEMAYMAIGRVNTEMDSTIGQARGSVPGGAGETSDILKERGVEKLTLADGPTGLRLTPHFRCDSKGVLRKGGEVFGDISIPIESILHSYTNCHNARQFMGYEHIRRNG